jgi:hypothetical protein
MATPVVIVSAQVRNHMIVSVSEASPLDAHVLETLATHCLPYVDSQVMHCYTEYHPKSGGLLYRAHPNYQGKPWFDHVLVSWKDNRGNTRSYPSRIHAFINMYNVFPHSVINFPTHNKLVISQNPVSTPSSNPMICRNSPCW